MFEFWREATATSVPGLLCQSGRRRPENVSILSSLPSKELLLHTQATQAHYRHVDVTLACEQFCVTNEYLEAFKACMGCKRFFLKEKKNVMFLSKIDLFYCLVVLFVVSLRLRPF